MQHPVDELLTARREAETADDGLSQRDARPVAVSVLLEQPRSATALPLTSWIKTDAQVSNAALRSTSVLSRSTSTITLKG